MAPSRLALAPFIGSDTLETGSIVGLESIVECSVRTIARKAPTHMAPTLIGDRRFIFVVRPIIAIRPMLISVRGAVISVSYTHLTLPTNREV